MYTIAVRELAQFAPSSLCFAWCAKYEQIVSEIWLSKVTKFKLTLCSVPWKCYWKKVWAYAACGYMWFTWHHHIYLDVRLAQNFVESEVALFTTIQASRIVKLIEFLVFSSRRMQFFDQLELLRCLFTNV